MAAAGASGEEGEMAEGTAPRTVTLDTGGGSKAELPVIKGTIGPDVVDIRKLYGQTGMFTFDPGFTSTASTRSRITYIDGDQGVLLHGGYSIEELATKSDYLEVCYLILHGELPNAAQKAEFVHNITYHTMVHEQISYLMRGFRR